MEILYSYRNDNNGGLGKREIVNKEIDGLIMEGKLPNLRDIQVER